MLPTVERALTTHSQESLLLFPNANGGPLDPANIRNRVWHPALTCVMDDELAEEWVKVVQRFKGQYVKVIIQEISEAKPRGRKA